MIDQLIREALIHFRAEAILDVGPGYSNFSRLSASVTGCRHITYLDCAPNVLSFQRDACSKVGIEARFAEADLDVLETTASLGTFDIIHCQEVLEHLSTPSAMVRWLTQQLAPSGKLIVTVPTRRSERWLKFLNPGYMRNEPHGHVQEFSEGTLRQLLANAGLTVRVFADAQPQYFVAHSWMAISRMKVEGATGRILTDDWRTHVFQGLLSLSSAFFGLTGMQWWCRMLPRNYFAVAERDI